MLITRAEVDPKDCWDVSTLYPNMAAWEKHFQQIHGKERADGDHSPRWPKIAAFQGQLGDGVEVLKEFLETTCSLDRQLSKLYTYAHLRHDEDITNDQYKNAYSRIASLVHEFATETSWFEPELLALPETLIHVYLSSSLLEEYKFHLEKIIRLKKHTLSPENEKLLALSGKALQSSQKTFSAINDADFKFGTVLDGEGKERELSHGTYGLYIRDRDRVLRENAFKSLHGQFNDYENTMCELLSGQVNKHLFNTRARDYSSCVEASLFPKNINISVYRALIQAVRSKLPVLHKYMALRKRIMKVSELHFYDVYVPLIDQVDIKMSYQEAEKIVIDSVAPLGKEYQKALKKGMQTDRWVDRYENKNKRSGAYSSGCFDSMPYILMNFKGQLKDVFTLAHEAGHSMHSLLSRTNQPYHYSDYPIFVAEVASTFNEALLAATLMERVKTREERLYLINQQIEDIRGTLFRQTMFAEFELLIHTMTEKDIPLTPKTLKEEYRKLNEAYFGPSVVLDDLIDIEWARIPHFYYNFYVYQYATGISAALSLVEIVTNGGDKEREAYLNFLKGGSSHYPIELLQLAGVDMRSPKPVKTAIDKFEVLVKLLEKEFLNQ
jgi:oligoendopeptidase F